jgi:hypothetical protein
MTAQCHQQCHQCHHSAYSSAIKKRLFSLVSVLQCHQCHQIPITLLRARAHTHIGALLSRELMALMALIAGDLHKDRPAMALSDGTALALVMALLLADQAKTGGAS